MKHISSKQILSLYPEKIKNYLIIDVRTSDYVGGHLINAHHIPINDYITIKNIVEDQKNIIIYCMFSKVRGYETANKLTKDYPKKNIFLLEGGFFQLFNNLIAKNKSMICDLDWKYWKYNESMDEYMYDYLQ